MKLHNRVALSVPMLILLSATSFVGSVSWAQSPDEQTKSRVQAAIEDYVRQDVDLKEKFLLLDPRNGEPLALSFDHVHSGVYEHEAGYRACVDFTDASGTLYDVDIVVSVEDGDSEVREVFLHKVDGEVVQTPSN